MGQLEGRYAVVTGGARGIGRAIVLAFADEEAAGIAIVDRDEQGARRLADELEAAGTRAISVTADVSDEDEVSRVAEEVEAAFGRVDVLVNNAGIATGANVAEMSLEMWDETLAVDLTSVFLCSRVFVPGMVERGYGRIVNVGSQLGLRGSPGVAHYCAAKGAVHAFTKSLAREVAGRGINVNAIAPGPTETDLLASIPDDALEAIRQEVPLGRFARPEEIAPTAVLLASETGGAYYTGSVLNVSGGHVM